MSKEGQRLVKLEFETEFEYLVRARAYHEANAMQVLKGLKQLKTKGSPPCSKEEQQKKNHFLYKYHEYYYNHFNSLINQSYVKK